jgi:biopolymer transport protein ExbD
MKGFGKNKEEEQAGEIDLTPMLDVVFILLIFFIVTSVFVKEAGYEINYPEAAMVDGVDGEPILMARATACRIAKCGRRYSGRPKCTE